MTDGVERITRPTDAYDPEQVFGVLRPAGGDADRIALLAALREGVAGLPETRETFAITDVVDLDGVEWTAGERLAELVGAWPLPAHWPGGSTARRYANPHCPHAYRYSDCYVPCQCGYLVTAINGDERLAVGEMTDHAPDCPRIEHWRARHRLWERRKARMERCARLGVGPVALARRCGYRRDSVSGTTHRHAVDIGACREAFRESLAHTALAHLETHSAAAIGRAFGYAGHEAVVAAVREYVGDVDFKAFERRRRRADR